MVSRVLWSELVGLGLAVAFSPVHIALVLLLLLGPQPLRRGGCFVLAWLAASALMLLVLLGVGHGLVLSMERGSALRTGLDLLAGGGLLALGLRELLVARAVGDEPPAWSRKLDRFVAMPLAPLLGLSTLLQLCSPDDLFLYAKASGGLLAAGLGRGRELVVGGVFCLTTGVFVLLPVVALLRCASPFSATESAAPLISNATVLKLGGVRMPFNDASRRRSSRTKYMHAEQISATAVATAVPATPSPVPNMRTGSSAMSSTFWQKATRSGVRALSVPRKAANATAEKAAATALIDRSRKYRAANGAANAPSGNTVRRTWCGHPTRAIMPKAPSAQATKSELHVRSCTPSTSPAANARATNGDVTFGTKIKMLNRELNTWLATPCPASEIASPNLPTQKVSNAPGIDGSARFTKEGA